MLNKYLAYSKFLHTVPKAHQVLSLNCRRQSKVTLASGGEKEGVSDAQKKNSDEREEANKKNPSLPSLKSSSISQSLL